MSRRIDARRYEQEFVRGQIPHLLLDVRTAQEFADGHIPGAINIELNALPARLHDIPTDRPVIVYCRSGRRSADAAQLLAQAGYRDVRDLGGIIEWAAQGFSIR